MLFTICLLFLLRNEVIIWCFLSYMVFYFGHKFSFTDFIFTLLTSLLLSYFALDGIITYILKLINLTSSGFGSFQDALYFVIKARYYRQFSDADGSGSTTAILSPDQFSITSFESFIFLSFFSGIVLTYWKHGLIINIARITYSIVLTRATIFTFGRSKLSKISFLFFITALSSYIIYAPFIVNGGNALRMRLASLALFLIMVNIDNSKRKN